MSRFNRERLVSSAHTPAESKAKQQDGTPTDAVGCTHVPVGYENRTKVRYLVDGRLYYAYHVSSGKIHLFPLGDGPQRRLEEREAGDVSVIA